MPHDNTDINGFGERLKQAIIDSSYNQKDISEILGINQDTITNYVKEKSLPKADVLLKLCVLLKVSADSLLSGTYKEKKDDQECSIGKLSDYEVYFLSRIRAGHKAIFDFDITQLPSDAGNLDIRENDMIIKFRQLSEEDKQDAYEIINLKYERGLRMGIVETTKSYPLTNGNGNMVG